MQANLARNQAKWQSRKITPYRFTTFISSAFFVVTVSSEVKAGQITSSSVEGAKTPELKESFLQRYGTIENVFQQAGRKGSSTDLRVDITYDATYGFPSSISTNSKTNAPDGGSDVMVTDFTPL